MKKKEYLTDVAIISVTNTEFAAVMLFHDWKAKTVAGDDQIYDVAEFERDGKTHKLVCVKQGEMGMPSAAATTMKVIDQFRPKYVIMVKMWGEGQSIGSNDAMDLFDSLSNYLIDYLKIKPGN